MSVPPAPTRGNPAVRRPGRPRSLSAHQAILDAALDLLAAEGYERMTIEAVAARAGVGKTTIYRRWASKEDLIIDAMENLISEVHPPDTGSVRDDLVELLTQMQRVLASSRAGDVFPRMVAEVAAGSALGRAYLQRVIGPRFAMVDSILARGVRRGELSADLDLDVARDLLVGPVVVAKLTGRLTPRAAPQRAAQLVDTLLGGLATSAPGRPPSRRDRKGDLS
ncbi:MAG TPA: TetR/AcrR family transcriptional regulator [Acidimicrobiia bacterium]|nr:TetR/AcrR family transcriptional regulator [Acidimicrobiia bacterium]